MVEGIYIEDEQTTFNLLSIDPGTTTLGYSVLKVEIDTLEIKEAFAWTVDATRLDFYRDDIIATHGEKFARIMSHKKNLHNVLCYYQPLIVISETPFFNRFRPSAAGPLFELLTTIEQTVFEWDKQKPLYKVEPKTVKKKVNASQVVGKNKEEMKEALKKIEELQCANLDLLDQHSVDALAIGYYHLTELRKRKGS